MSVLVAGLLDAAVGEPPAAAHPVVWMGRYLARAEALLPAAPARRAVAAGGLAWLGGVTLSVAAAAAVEAAAGRLPGAWRAVVRGSALWPLLSARMLLVEVGAVEVALRRDLRAGRAALSRIVSRETAGLTPTEVRAAALGSLAENLSDSWVAPLCWYVVAGLPGAACYRFVNTADATWGYRTRRWRHAGRVAAYADDAANLAPARLTAALLLPRRDRWAQLRYEARRTASPNAGWPIAALALGLDLRLGKRGSYLLNPGGTDPGPRQVAAALRLAGRTVVVAAALAAAVEHFSSPTEGEAR